MGWAVGAGEDWEVFVLWAARGREGTGVLWVEAVGATWALWVKWVWAVWVVWIKWVWAAWAV